MPMRVLRDSSNLLNREGLCFRVQEIRESMSVMHRDEVIDMSFGARRLRGVRLSMCLEGANSGSEIRCSAKASWSARGYIDTPA